MNKFEKQLEKWNNGVLRGAQAKLAKILGVSTATTALWATGKRHPSKGYVAKMASLFDLDVYHVVKLFENNPVLYTTPKAPSSILRESNHDGYLANASLLSEKHQYIQSNTAHIPFLSTIPANPTTYNPNSVLEWWNLPLRYSLGAKYIVPSKKIGLKGATDPDDLCFINPCIEPCDGDWLVIKNKKGEFSVSKKIDEKKGEKRVGVIVRRISSLK